MNLTVAVEEASITGVEDLDHAEQTSINGVVYDVSELQWLYGTNGVRNHLAGKSYQTSLSSYFLLPDKYRLKD